MEELRPTILRDEARAALAGNWNRGALVAFVGMFILEAGIIGLGKGGMLLSYLYLFLVSPMMIGLYFVFQDLFREKITPTVPALFAPFNDYVRYALAYLLVNVYVLLWMLLLVVPGIIKAISYSMTFYIMRDNPEMSSSEAIDKSMAMMEGHKMELFLLGLSFLGWFILGAITVVGIFWVIPYIYTAYAAFYEKIKNGSETDINVTPAVEGAE